MTFFPQADSHIRNLKDATGTDTSDLAAKKVY